MTAAFDINSVSSPLPTRPGGQSFDINAVSSIAAPVTNNGRGTAPSAPAPAGKPGIFAPFGDTISRALGAVKQDVAEDWNAAGKPSAQGPVAGYVDSFIHPFAPGGVLRGGKEAVDAVNAAMSPVAGAVNVVATPLKKATGLDLNQALMGMGPEMGAVAAPEAAEAVAGASGADAAASAEAAPAAAAPTAPATPSKPVRGASPYAAAMSRGGAERQAAKIIASRATDLSAVKAALAEPAQLVPGSQPTTFQQTGDGGLGALEKETATADPAPYAQRRADQNVARTDALTGIQSGGDPNDVAAALKSQFDDLDAATQAHVDNLTADAQAKTEAAGGAGNPEDYGSQVRAIVGDAESAARGRERGLWKTVDPNRDLTGNTVQTAQAAKDIAGAVSSTAKPMAGEEAAIFNVASDLPPLSPVSDLIDLRSRVSTEMRNELINNGSSPTYARLTQLRGAIQDNLANTIAQKVSMDDAAVARGTMAPEDALASKVKGWTDAFKSERAEALASGSGTVPAFEPGGAVSDGAGLPSPRGSGSPAGNQGLPRNDQPTFDAAAADRLAAATQATKARAATFGQQPVSNVLAKAGSADQFRLPDGRVASSFFKPGSTGYQTMQALYKASDPAAIGPVIEDYAAHTLRRAAMRDDGTIAPAKFASWQKMFSDSLRALPEEVRAKFSTAAEAGATLDAASAARVVALKQAQSGALGKVMHLSSPESIVKTVGQILTSRTAVEDMASLAKATAGNEEARQGLRQAVADFITSKFVGNTEAGTSGVSQIKADAYQTFFRQNRAALNLIFKPDEVAMMDQVARDIQRSNRSISAIKMPGNSNTATDLAALAKKPVVKSKSTLDILGTIVGSHFGPAGAVVGGVGSHVLQSMRAAGISRVDELVSTAMLHPNVARELLKKIEPTANPSLATMKLSAALRRANGMKAALPIAAAASEREDRPSR